VNDIRLMQERAARLAALDAAIARGLADADAGRVRPVSEVFDRLEAKYRAEAEGSRRGAS
jgi:antitoxin ParD1/3/4